MLALDIACIQNLKLLMSHDELKRESSEFLHKTCFRFRRVCAQDNKFIISNPDDIQQFQHKKITWRPKFCKDVFIFIPKNIHEVRVGMMFDDNIKFFKSFESDMATTCSEDIVLMGHMTCDQFETQNQMVVLIYDFFREDIMASEPSYDQRYADLLTNRCFFEKIKIGNACIRVQWVGDMHCYDKLKGMQVPHEKDCIVSISDAGYCYLRECIET